jgi:hypothetical protein
MADKVVWEWAVHITIIRIHHQRKKTNFSLSLSLSLSLESIQVGFSLHHNSSTAKLFNLYKHAYLSGGGGGWKIAHTASDDDNVEGQVLREMSRPNL